MVRWPAQPRGQSDERRLCPGAGSQIGVRTEREAAPFKRLPPTALPPPPPPPPSPVRSASAPEARFPLRFCSPRASRTHRLWRKAHARWPLGFELRVLLAQQHLVEVARPPAARPSGKGHGARAPRARAARCGASALRPPRPEPRNGPLARPDRTDRRRERRQRAHSARANAARGDARAREPGATGARRGAGCRGMRVGRRRAAGRARRRGDGGRRGARDVGDGERRGVRDESGGSLRRGRPRRGRRGCGCVRGAVRGQGDAGARIARRLQKLAAQRCGWFRPFASEMATKQRWAERKAKARKRERRTIKGEAAVSQRSQGQAREKQAERVQREGVRKGVMKRARERESTRKCARKRARERRSAQKCARERGSVPSARTKQGGNPCRMRRNASESAALSFALAAPPLSSAGVALSAGAWSAESHRSRPRVARLVSRSAASISLTSPSSAPRPQTASRILSTSGSPAAALWHSSSSLRSSPASPLWSLAASQGP